jgi:hypothetical protein
MPSDAMRHNVEGFSLSIQFEALSDGTIMVNVCVRALHQRFKLGV